MNKNLVLYILLLIVVGCESQKPVQLTYEQAVFESAFIEIVGNAYQNVYIVGVNDIEWFKRNEYDSVIKRMGFDQLEHLSPSLLAKLYELNEKQSPLNWKPLMISSTILGAEFADGYGADFRDKRCMVPLGEENAGIVSREEKYGLRSYYSVSKVAVDEVARTAVFKFGYYCAAMAGGGEWLVVLKFNGKQWIVKETYNFWVS